jgi:hypothetical protein
MRRPEKVIPPTVTRRIFCAVRDYIYAGTRLLSVVTVDGTAQ